MASNVDTSSLPEFVSTLPLADQQSLSGLSDPEIRSWTVARASEYRKFALTLLAVHNSIAPIHCLPNELLSVILSSSWANRKSLRLAHVCRRWRQVLLATPKFWVDAVDGEYLRADGEYRDPPEYIATILQRSAPLYIRPDFVHFTEQLAEDLQPHSWRVVYLAVDIKNTDEVQELHQLLRMGMPVLKKLIVRYEPYCPDEHDREHDDSDHAGLCGLNALEPHVLPRLEDVNIPSFLFPEVAVPSLLHVRLHRANEYHDNPKTDVEELLSALAGCLRLLSLELVNVLDWDAVARVSPQMQAIILPSLQHFHISDVSVRVTAILPYITSPSIVDVHVDTTVIHPYGAPTRPDVGLREWLRPTLLPGRVLADVDTVAITTYYNSTLLQCYLDGEARLHVNCKCSMQQEDFVALADALRSTAAVAELRWTSDWIAPHVINGLGQLLRTLHGIVSLVVRGEEAAAEILSVLRPSEDATALAGCPLLRELTLHFVWSRMLEHTHGQLDQVLSLEGAASASQLSVRCAQIESALAPRASRFGSRLTYLEFNEWYDLEKCRDVIKPLCIVPAVDLLPPLASSESPLQSLRDLVDGPVIFGGFHIQQRHMIYGTTIMKVR